MIPVLEFRLDHPTAGNGGGELSRHEFASAAAASMACPWRSFGPSTSGCARDGMVQHRQAQAATEAGLLEPRRCTRRSTLRHASDAAACVRACPEARFSGSSTGKAELVEPSDALARRMQSGMPERRHPSRLARHSAASNSPCWSRLQTNIPGCSSPAARRHGSHPQRHRAGAPGDRFRAGTQRIGCGRMFTTSSSWRGTGWISASLAACSTSFASSRSSRIVSAARSRISARQLVMTAPPICR